MVGLESSCFHSVRSSDLAIKSQSNAPTETLPGVDLSQHGIRHVEAMLRELTLYVSDDTLVAVCRRAL
jgi:hypothetical protein